MCRKSWTNLKGNGTGFEMTTGSNPYREKFRERHEETCARIGQENLPRQKSTLGACIGEDVFDQAAL